MNDVTPGTSLDVALDYIKRGWSPVPVPHRKKGPVIEEWTGLRITVETAPGYFGRQPQNIGVLLGSASGNLADVDVDCPEALKIVRCCDGVLPTTGTTFGRRSKPESHWLYITNVPAQTKRYHDVVKNDKGAFTTLIEIRGDGAQTVFPGSVHVSGEAVVWHQYGEPEHVAADQLTRHVRWIAAAALLARHWPGEGARHDAASALGGILWRAQWEPDDAVRFARAVVLAAGDPEVEDRARAVADTFAHDTGDEVTGWPTLLRMLGPAARAVADRVSDWLGLTQTVGQRQNGRASETHDVGADNAAAKLSEVVLPGGPVTVSAAAATLGALLAANGGHFVKGGTVVATDGNTAGEPSVRPVPVAAFPSQFEKVARLVKVDQRNGAIRPAICSEQAAKLIVNADTFLEQLPPISIVSPCPVLIERDGRLVQVAGYDRESGILAGGQEVSEIPLAEARHRLNVLVQDFAFATESDRARALAAVITPGLIFGGLLPGRAALDLGEADQSQAGKGFRNKLTAAIYGQKVKAITKRTGGVGGLQESFDSALVSGANFIALDNVRGQVDSQGLESFLTEDSYLARIPYQRGMDIDPRRVVVMLTSNRAEITPDLANRSSCVRLLKQPAGYECQEFPEGDLLDHVRANPAPFLAAVFAVIRTWHEAGKPRTKEPQHDFRAWAQTLDWITQEPLGAGPLLEGHRKVQDRMANPTLTWLRDVVHIVDRAGRMGQALRAYELLNLLIDAGEPAIPGAQEDADLTDEATRGKALLGLGRQLARCFQDEDQLEIDGVRVERTSTPDQAGRDIREYRFSRVSPITPHAPPMFPPCSPIPPMGTNIPTNSIVPPSTLAVRDTSAECWEPRGVWGTMGENGVVMGEDGGNADSGDDPGALGGDWAVTAGDGVAGTPADGITASAASASEPAPSAPSPARLPAPSDQGAALPTAAAASRDGAVMVAAAGDPVAAGGNNDRRERYIATNPARQAVIDLIEDVRQTDPEWAEDLTDDWKERLAIAVVDDDCKGMAEQVALADLRAAVARRQCERGPSNDR